VPVNDSQKLTCQKGVSVPFCGESEFSWHDGLIKKEARIDFAKMSFSFFL